MTVALGNGKTLLQPFEITFCSDHPGLQLFYLTSKLFSMIGTPKSHYLKKIPEIPRAATFLESLDLAQYSTRRNTVLPTIRTKFVSRQSITP